MNFSTLCSPFQLTILYFLCMFIGQTGAFKILCEDEWTAVDDYGVCIRGYPISKTYDEAAEFCAQRSAHLVRIWGSSMNEIAADIAAKWSTTTPTYDRPLLLGIKYGDHLKYYWPPENTTQIPYFDVTRWKVPRATEKCVAIKKDRHWYPIDCNERNSFICGKEIRLCPAGFIPSAFSLTCVMISGKDQMVDFFAGQKYCENFGSELVRIADVHKNEFIREHAHELQPHWINLYDHDGNGTFQRFNNSDDEMTYWNWAAEYPKSENGTPQCVYLMRINGKWANQDCQAQAIAICEKSASCEKGTYGVNCLLTCSPYCGGLYGECNSSDGLCIEGCKSGYQGALCDSACEKGTYGVNCLLTCSPYCGGLYGECDPSDGLCIEGCKPGYQGALCDSECMNGTYGMNCSLACSSSCGGVNPSCHHVTGFCFEGCEEGYEGDKCNLKFDAGTHYTSGAILGASAFVILIATVCLIPKVQSLVAGKDNQVEGQPETYETPTMQSSSRIGTPSRSPAVTSVVDLAGKNSNQANGTWIILDNLEGTQGTNMNSV